MSSGVLMRLTEVIKTYGDGVKVPALRGITLDIMEGEFLVLLGHSGSGKSTLLNIVGGVDGATSGQVLFRGSDLVSASGRELRRYRREHVGYVFQFYNLIASLTARENILLAAEMVGSPASVDELITAVGLDEKANRFPSHLSGGEQQRVAIARAVVKSPDLLLCDEPTGALDSGTGDRVIQLIRELNLQRGTAVVMATHNRDIATVADRVVELRDGRIVNTSGQPA